MYSKNDYRYYLEHRLNEENYLSHYGVKGMKWRKRRTSKTLSDTAQYVSDKGFLNYVDSEKLYKEHINNKAKSLRMDRVDSVARNSSEKVKKLYKREPQIKAGSRLLSAEIAYGVDTGIHNALKVKRNKRRR